MAILERAVARGPESQRECVIILFFLSNIEYLVFLVKFGKTCTPLSFLPFAHLVVGRGGRASNREQDLPIFEEEGGHRMCLRAKTLSP